MGVSFSIGKFEKQYLHTQEELRKIIYNNMEQYLLDLRSELYRIMLSRTLSRKEYEAILDRMQSAIGIYTLDVQKEIKKIYVDVLNESRLGNKDYKQAILNYETAKAVNDVTNQFSSAYNDTKQALDHIQYVMNTQSKQDQQAIWNNIKNLSPKDIKENIEAYKDVFTTDYGQRIMQQLTENPMLNKLITQEDDKLYITMNGKKYDLDSYITNQAKYYTTNMAHQVARAEDKENGFTIFRFVRIEDVEHQRPHSIHDNEHNDDVFTTDPNLVDLEFDGKILLDAYKDIPDYPYGEQPPFGCRHVWVGVAKGLEINPDGPNEPVNSAAASENETEKSVGNGEMLAVGDRSKLSPTELKMIEDAEKQPLSNAIFKGTKLSTDCRVISYDFGDNGYLGDYSDKDKTIRISNILENSLKRGMCKIKNNIGYFTEDEILALDTYAHEWVHSISNKTVFNDIRQLYKDILTEYVARALVHEQTGIIGFGGYDDEIKDFLRRIKPNVNPAAVMLYLKSENINAIQGYFNDLLFKA